MGRAYVTLHRHENIFSTKNESGCQNSISMGTKGIPVTRRHTAVKEDGRVLLHLKDGPEEPEVVSVPKHKKHPPAGVKATTRTRVGS